MDCTPQESNTGPLGLDATANKAAGYDESAVDLGSDFRSRAATGAAVVSLNRPASAPSSEPAGLLQRLAKSLSEQAATRLVELADLWPNLTADDQEALLDHAHALAAMRQGRPNAALVIQDETIVSAKRRGKSKA